MYATIRNYAGNTELADTLVANESDVKRVIGEIDGVRAYYLVRTEDGAASITVTDDESGADASNQAAAAWIRENAPQLAGSAPQISAGEVVISL